MYNVYLTYTVSHAVITAQPARTTRFREYIHCTSPPSPQKRESIDVPF